MDNPFEKKHGNSYQDDEHQKYSFPVDTHSNVLQDVLCTVFFKILLYYGYCIRLY